MKRWLVGTLSVLLVSVALPVCSQSAETFVFPDTEYISGKSGYAQKIKGRLIIQESGIAFQSKEGNPVFEIPIATVKSVSGGVETDPGSFGRKMALGIFASKREEFLLVKTETADAAEAITFKCKKKTSDTMAAKIEFQRKKAQPPAAADPATPPAAPSATP